MLFLYELFLWFCVKEWSGLVWKAFCFIRMNQVPGYLNSQTPYNLSLVQMNRTVFKLSIACWSFNFWLFTLWCSSGFAGCVFLVWYSWGKSMNYTLLLFYRCSILGFISQDRLSFFFPCYFYVLHGFWFHIHGLFVFFKTGKSSQQLDQ